MGADYAGNERTSIGPHNNIVRIGVPSALEEPEEGMFGLHVDIPCEYPGRVRLASVYLESQRCTYLTVVLQNPSTREMRTECLGKTG
jgi:hypothetical protein